MSLKIPDERENERTDSGEWEEIEFTAKRIQIKIKLSKKENKTREREGERRSAPTSAWGMLVSIWGTDNDTSEIISAEKEAKAPNK